MKAWSTAPCGEAVGALSVSLGLGDSALRSAVHRRPAVVNLIDRMVG
ncbi:MAG: hypothetical protein Q7U99_25505 [Rubrivivax sp.]|nr:hypothetical protein [Rubrivivax sp.]